jgi:hypothetical protein
MYNFEVKMKSSENGNILDRYKQNIPTLKELIDERKQKAVETLSISYAENRLPLEEYERIVEYINKIESERELIVVEKIVAEYSVNDSPASKKTEQPAYNDNGLYYTGAYKNSKENMTVLSSRTFEGPLTSGSQFVNILGSEQIIIRKADLHSGQTVLNLVSILGDSVIFVEQGINVVNRTIPILGNSETKVKHYNNSVHDKELIVSGASILGNITIKPL